MNKPLQQTQENKMKLFVLSSSFLLVLSIANLTNASLITFQFSGQVQNITGPSDTYSLSVEDTISGQFTINTEYFTPDGHAHSGTPPVGGGISDYIINFSPAPYWSSSSVKWGATSEQIDSFFAISSAYEGVLHFDSEFFFISINETYSTHTVWTGTTNTFNEIPEPTSVVLFGIGFIGIIVAAQKKNISCHLSKFSYFDRNVSQTCIE